VPEVCLHEHDLARLHIGAVDGELGETGDAVGHRQAILYPTAKDKE
jgi:hypothetical protein